VVIFGKKAQKNTGNQTLPQGLVVAGIFITTGSL
jgi:hypothetical protein